MKYNCGIEDRSLIRAVQASIDQGRYIAKSLGVNVWCLFRVSQTRCSTGYFLRCVFHREWPGCTNRSKTASQPVIVRGRRDPGWTPPAPSHPLWGNMKKRASLVMVKASKWLFLICSGLRATRPTRRDSKKLRDPWTVVSKYTRHDEAGRRGPRGS